MDRAPEGLNPHKGGLILRFFPGITESVLHRVGQPAAEGGDGSKGMGHG
jgi:hypothetical protein